MLIFKEMALKPKADVIELKNGLCLTDDESIAFDMLILKGASYQQVADEIYKSTRTVTRIAYRLKNKIINYYCLDNG